MFIKLHLYLGSAVIIMLVQTKKKICVYVSLSLRSHDYNTSQQRPTCSIFL